MMQALKNQNWSKFHLNLQKQPKIPLDIPKRICQMAQKAIGTSKHQNSTNPKRRSLKVEIKKKLLSKQHFLTDDRLQKDGFFFV
jgi:hypothetical protein